MENALNGALSEQKHQKLEESEAVAEMQTKVDDLEHQLEVAHAAAAKGAPADPVAALRKIYSLGTLTAAQNATAAAAASAAAGPPTDVGPNEAEAAELGEKANELRSASTVVEPSDAEALAAIADKLQGLGEEEGAAAAEAGAAAASGSAREDDAAAEGGASGASGSEADALTARLNKMPETESEQLQLMALRLSAALSGKGLGPTAQDADRSGAEGASGAAPAAAEEVGASGAGADADDTGTSADDLKALQKVAEKLAMLAAGASGAEGGGASGAAAAVEPEVATAADAIGEAMSALAEGAGGEAEGGEEDIAAEAMTDEQLEGRVARLQAELDEVNADNAASGAAGGEGGDDASSSGDDSGEDDGATVPAGENAEEEEEEAAAAGGGSDDGSDASAADDAPAADAPAEDEAAEKAAEDKADADKGFRKSATVERNTLMALEADTEEAGTPMSVPVKTEGGCEGDEAGCGGPPTPPKDQDQEPEIVPELGETPVPQGEVVATTRRLRRR